MTDLEVCNWALLKLGDNAPPLTSLKDEKVTLNAGLCNLLLTLIHRSFLRTFIWNFAVRSVCLAPLSQKDETHYKLLPKKYLKVKTMGTEGELRGDCIVVNSKSSSSFAIQYIEEVALSDCDPIYQEAITCKLASELCPVLTTDSQLTLRLKKEKLKN
ncbi:MAG: hypothetical protein C4617_05495 [Candidatus Liberibacter europaeus]|uniref:Uncharacterized protein n=1 Tax=Candidatus Liberibacter europaeus TaxID=744859 RepID=A0A2T4VWE5_9HYPH|nr:hypothetical protein [Candidatus Liberibacter europaeus]PTL86102.1 MAG: hypothetical protein C4617_05495 [Candidatus Liberibacter europaeus]